MTLANYLYALVYSDVYDEESWMNWAEKILQNAEYTDNTEWIYNVYFAENKKQLYDAISDRMLFEDYLCFNCNVLTEIIQGYYYLQYQNNKISLYEMLEKSGNVADAGQDSMGCEFFYQLLNEIDEYPNIINTKEFMTKITSYFTPLSVVAIEQKRKLEMATVDDLNVS